MNQRDRYGRAGFVLPTVTMVLLVVVLLTIAITLRSFDRAKIAQYRRVDESVLQAATPALERAKAKIEYLFSGNEELIPPRDIPSEKNLQFALSKNDPYTLPDEDRLELTFGGDSIDTAWRFPVDTNNDSVPDTYTLYGIYQRTPETSRARTPLEARTPPRTSSQALRPGCEATNTSASLIGGLGWSQSGGKLKKSFYVYVASVPIEGAETTGSPGFSALEYQQDVARVPLTNNAVVYRDDLAITPGPAFRINGRVLTNSNLLVTPFRNPLTFYRVSGVNSCFYDDLENSKIIVGGDVVSGAIDNNTANPANVHLYQGQGREPNTQKIEDGSNETVTNSPRDVLNNGEAYARRIGQLIELGKGTTLFSEIEDEEERDKSIRKYFEDRTRRVPYAEVPAVADLDVDSALATLQGTVADDNLRAQDNWIYSMTVANGGEIGETGRGNNQLSLSAGANYRFKASDPEDLEVENELGDRILVGNGLPAIWYVNGQEAGEDREQIIEGVTWEGSEEPRTRRTRVEELPDTGDTGRDGFWEIAAGREPEDALDNYGGLRIITSSGFYDRSLSFLPPPKRIDSDDNIVSTYDDPASPATEAYEIVWPDTMPMSPAPGSKVYDNAGGNWISWSDAETELGGEPTGNDKYAKGDLRMRASVVYHYASENGHYPLEEVESFQETGDWSAITKPTPIACVSSYYDPSTSETARNEGDGGRSNNGIVYNPPAAADWSALALQANKVFPDGRFVNPNLKSAVDRNASGEALSLADQAAVDATMCAIGILDGSLSTSTIIPDGAIYETAFLNAREIKAIDQDNTADTPRVDETFPVVSPTAGHEGIGTEYAKSYTLRMEERQPLEVRTTVIDLEQLRTNTIEQSVDEGPQDDDDNEYLLPFSGIIYASRDDALKDVTAGASIEQAETSATDAKLDPTRRPNGIMLIHTGENKCLNRATGGECTKNPAGSGPEEQITSIVQEKGLILVSDLPVYIKGELNPHTQEEFTNTLDDNWGDFYTREDLNSNFACRKGDPRLPACGEGDEWRPVTVLGDAVTLLSDNNGGTTNGFRFGFRNEGDFDLRNNAGGNALIFDDYDIDGDGTIGTTETLEESDYQIDLDGNGEINPDSDLVAENAITAKAIRQLNGFDPYNNFVTNGLSSGAFNPDGTPSDGTGTPVVDEDYQTATDNIVNSSYFNNFVTPIQRRGEFPEYVMEMCLKPFIAACRGEDWVIGYDLNDDGVREEDEEIPSWELVEELEGEAIDPFTSGNGFDPAKLLAGTTHLPPLDPNDRRFPRRIAFLRNSNGAIDLDSSNPIPWGIKSDDELECYASSNNKDVEDTSGNTVHTCANYSSTKPRSQENALWFMTNDNDTFNFGRNYPLWFYNPQDPENPVSLPSNQVVQPLLVPALQLGTTTQTPEDNMNVGDVYDDGNNTRANQGTGWIMPAGGDTTYNLILGTGDIPSRNFNANNAEFNGGLPNLPRLLENWRNSTIKIVGSFIQFKRSEYATAPYQPILRSNADDQDPLYYPENAFRIDDSFRRYQTASTTGTTPYFGQPSRNWGFDVGLLSQPPDLFAQTFSTSDTKFKPDEFLREVGRNDPWIETLLCATVQGGGNAVGNNARPSSCN